MAKYTQYSDETLIALSIKDQNCFAELFERYEETLLRYIKRISNVDNEHAQEILQEVFIKVWKNINGFDTNLKFSSWVYRITHNETISTWKKEKKHLLNQYTGELDIQNIGEHDDIIDNLTQKADKLKLQHAITKLPLKYKEVLILRFWEHKEYAEISAILKKPQNTIGTLIRRAKIELKKILDESQM